jgi:hypothetical protein
MPYKILYGVKILDDLLILIWKENSTTLATTFNVIQFSTTLVTTFNVIQFYL